MTLRRKLIWSALFMLGLFLLMGFLSSLRTQKSELASLFEKETMYLQMMLRGINEIIITEAMPSSVKIAVDGVEGFDKLHLAVEPELKDPELASAYREKINPAWQRLKADVKPFLDVNLDTEDDELLVQYGRIMAEADQLFLDVETLALKAKETAETTELVTRNMIKGTVVLILLGSGFLFYHLYRSILSPITDLTNVATGFGKGDLNLRIDESRKDEFGKLAVHFNRGTNELRDIAAQLVGMINNLASSSSELMGTATDLYTDSEEQAKLSEQSASAISEMSQTILDVSRNAADAASASGDASKIAENGRAVVRETVLSMQGISESVRDTANAMDTLTENTAKIGTIVSVINDIADQTNLLALNAAIEAARAGEHGRGFAIVADEVRKLAERTGRATQEIAEMVSAIQAGTEKSHSSMENDKERVTQGVKLVEDASKSLESIVEVSAKGSDMVQRIAASAEEQSSATDTISLSMESIASAARRTASSSEAIKLTSESLSRMAEELNRMAAWFKTH